MLQKEFSKLLIEGARELHLSLTEAQVGAFKKYLQELNAWKKIVNLGHRAGDREIILKDFLDSMTILQHLSLGAAILDLGSGAGFPGIPIKILHPGIQLTLVESIGKKAAFCHNQ